MTNLTIKMTPSVLEFIKQLPNNHVKNNKHKFTVMGQDINISRNSVKRLKIFSQKTPVCVCCKADNAILKFKDSQFVGSFVTNSKGKLTELTVDHDILACLGGDNSIENLNPMCYNCNNLRGSYTGSFQAFLTWYNEKYLTGEEQVLSTYNYSSIELRNDLTVNDNSLVECAAKELISRLRSGKITTIGNINNISYLLYKRMDMKEYFHLVHRNRLRCMGVPEKFITGYKPKLKSKRTNYKKYFETSVKEFNNNVKYLSNKWERTSTYVKFKFKVLDFVYKVKNMIQ